MPVETDHLADEIKDLTASVNHVRADFAGFKGSVERELQRVRTLGKFVAGVLVAIMASSLGFAWQAGALSMEVRMSAVHLEKRMDKLETRFDKLEAKVDQLETRFDKLDAKVDHIEQQLGLILQRLDPAAAKTKPN
jgi:outer membrane murein-binding lipoprotein Lpp